MNGAPQQPGESPVSSALEVQSTDVSPEPTPPPSSHRATLVRLKQLATGRRAVWAVVAVLCVAAAAAGSVLGAHAVARTDAAKARQAVPRTAAAIASTLKLAIQHEEDLIISAGTFFAGNPEASAPQFDTWVKWAEALHRYPELEKLGLVALVNAPELAAFQARITGHPLKPLGSRSPLGAGGTLRALPVATRPSCLASVELGRSPVKHTGTGLDYCALAPALLTSRHTGQNTYAPFVLGHTRTLGLETPVYSGGSVPDTVAARRKGFLGWLGVLLAPEVVVGRARAGQCAAWPGAQTATG